MMYSIESERDGASVAAEVVMLRAASDSTILILEGTSDYKLFIRFTGDCELVIASGKENCLTAIGLLNNRGVSGVITVVDADYDRFLRQESCLENVIVTEFHDIESMLFLSPSLDSVMIELASDEKVRTNKSLGRSIRHDILFAAYPMGVARFYSQKNGLHLKFKDLKFKYLGRNLEFCSRDLFKEVINHSQKQGLSVDSYLAEIEAWRGTPHDPWDMCCGHDLCRILGIALQSLWGTQNSNRVTQEEVESRLRLAFDAEFFRNSEVYSRIKTWEVRNAPRTILKM